jgi:nuclease HARBI1
MVDLLGIPATVITDNRLRATDLEALCMLLRRFAYPIRHGDLVEMFGRGTDEISRIVNQLSASPFDAHKTILHFDSRRLTPQYLERLAAAVRLKGAPLKRCWEFVDGTVRSICRPGSQQKHVCNGHKRVHALKFQSLVSPDGIIVHLGGP